MEICWKICFYSPFQQFNAIELLLFNGRMLEDLLLFPPFQHAACRQGAYLSRSLHNQRGNARHQSWAKFCSSKVSVHADLRGNDSGVGHISIPSSFFLVFCPAPGVPNTIFPPCFSYHFTCNFGPCSSCLTIKLANMLLELFFCPTAV